MTTTPVRLRLVPVALVAVLAVVAGCGSGTVGPPSTASTTTSPKRAPSTTTSTTVAPTTTIDPSAPAVQRHGQLSVCGTDLCDRAGQVVQLRGMSTHGLQWYGQCLTAASLGVLFDDWRADLLRTSMYVHEGGYLTDPAGYTQVVRDLVDQLITLDRYAIIDWHVLSPGDPMTDVDAAISFFSGMAERYAESPNVIYEIANEPNGVPWSRIKEYAERVIPAIRAHDPDAVILVGTPAWSSFGISEGGSPAEVIADPIADDDLMYTFHFYAADFREPYLDALAQASAALPVFVSEFGAQESTGDGPNDFEMAQRFVDLMAQERISWVVWNFSDDPLTGAAWLPDTCDADGPWTPDRLKPAGAWTRDQLLAGR
ncbi:MAG: glycoside hydrolase family 5 protein [Actinomycetota bacterium]|nr:glycoside hydrolase family 5 protein [Actinomycetota bacterium]